MAHLIVIAFRGTVFKPKILPTSQPRLAALEPCAQSHSIKWLFFANMPLRFELDDSPQKGIMSLSVTITSLYSEQDNYGLSIEVGKNITLFPYNLIPILKLYSADSKK